MKLAHILVCINIYLFLPYVKAYPPNAQLLTKLEQLIAAYEKNNYHGIILVAKDDSVFFQRAYGFANSDPQPI